MTEWHYSKDNKKHIMGPVSTEWLTTALRRGGITKKTLVCFVGKENWMSIEELFRDSKRKKELSYLNNLEGLDDLRMVNETLDGKNLPQPENKKCPYCAETILFDAKKCKHCGEFLSKEGIRSWRPPRILICLVLGFTSLMLLFVYLDNYVDSGFYKAIRTLVSIVSIYVAYLWYKDKPIRASIYLLVGILFNPFFVEKYTSYSAGPEDLIVALLLLIYIFETPLIMANILMWICISFLVCSVPLIFLSYFLPDPGGKALGYLAMILLFSPPFVIWPIVWVLDKVFKLSDEKGQLKKIPRGYFQSSD